MKSKVYALVLAAVLVFSMFAISASAQVGQYVNVTPTDLSGYPVYFYSASSGNAAPHGNNVVDSYDVDLTADTATIYFKLGHVTTY
ncbi:MAG: hypothetical protein LBC26_08230, partial [Oscillospiraceae bacterium]|nr:hypothetical protein [Oscillospiraceae bacterium]